MPVRVSTTATEPSGRTIRCPAPGCGAAPRGAADAVRGAPVAGADPAVESASATPVVTAASAAVVRRIAMSRPVLIHPDLTTLAVSAAHDMGYRRSRPPQRLIV